ncbi:MAG: hypothetical protein IKL73_04510 [Lachnospiraceae bacterium]|nr:hypothetical protein [Lachnospiraceae bacterium]
MFNFILEKVAMFLRWLSLSANGAGNVWAWILYVLICISPIIVVVVFFFTKRIMICDLLLVLLSAVMFYAMYYLINPALFISGTDMTPEFANNMLCYAIYGVLCVYIVLRMICSYNKYGDLYRLAKSVYVMLWIVLAVMLVKEGVIYITNANNTGILGFFKRVKAETFIILNLSIIELGYRLIKLFKKYGFSDEVIRKTNSLKNFSVVSLAIMMFLELAYNMLQLPLRKHLNDLEVSYTFPVLNVLIVLVAIMITKYIIFTKEIKEENEKFI